MEGSGRKSFTKMIAVVLLIVGTLSGQIYASRETEYDACFNKCFDDCTEPNPGGDFDFFAKCDEDCYASCTKNSPLDSRCKTIAKIS
ncbi:hypothetical protein C5167_050811 [Papaver somniferum]|uniref:Knottin scorpion toxin-like domain-containing protein n=1 Tax=Papaver somniferum TaxID=3469 RepID=A0A4Y7KTR3_PAPSO|nr:hypothetical protein C5167_050811 [Papaver somniferum]